jgi:hypothetical protein
VSGRGLNREVADLRERIGPALCANPAPCAVATSSEVRVMPEGSEERTGAEPRPLCGGCPNREARAVRHVEVRLDHRGRYGHEQPASATRTAHNGHDRGPEGHGTPQATDAPTAPPEPEPEDGLPASWPADHPARLALEGREPPPRRRRSDSGAINSPEDFGYRRWFG